MIKNRILIAACSSLLFLGACKKKDENKPADQTNTAAKPAEPAKGSDTAAPTPTATAPAPAAATGGDTIANTEDYETKGSALMDKMINVFATDGKDCEKLATDITKFIDENKGEMDAITAYEKAHPDDKKAMDKKNEAKTKDFMDKAGPAMEACKDNKALQDAMAKMPD